MIYLFFNKTCDDFVVLVYVNYSHWEGGVLTALIIALIDSLRVEYQRVIHCFVQFIYLFGLPN